MDTAQNPHTPKVKQRFEAYKKRHNESQARYLNNLPVQMSRELNTAEMMLDRSTKTQPTKQQKCTAKQYDVLRQMTNTTGDHSTNVPKLNGAFTNNDLLQQQVSQKRSYAGFNNQGGGTSDDPMKKLSRVSEVNKQQYKVPSYDANQSIQPNVYPFQQSKDSTKLLTSSTATTSSSTSAVTNSVMSIGENMILSNNSGSISDLNDVLNDNSSNASRIKTEKSLPSSCSVAPLRNTSLVNHTQAETVTSNNSFNHQYNPSNDTLSALADLDNIDKFALYGNNKTSKNSSNSTANNTNNTIKAEKQTLKAEVNLNNMNSSGAPSQQQQQQQKWVFNDQKSNQQQNVPVKVSQSSNPLASLNRIASGQHMSDQLQSNGQQNQVQMGQSRPVHLNTMISTAMNQQQMKNGTNVKVCQPLTNNPVGSPRHMMQSPKNSLQSPMNNLQSSLNNSLSPSLPISNVPMQSTMPPNLPRLPTMPNMRQHLAEHINKHQQPIGNLPNVPNMNNPYMTANPGPTTAEKLQEHIKKREQARMQMQQMTNKPYIPQHMMSPMQNPMANMNPFQFPSDYQAYNSQQKAYEQQMGMQQQQQQQSSPMGYFSSPYQMDQVPGGQLFPNTAPPGYNSQNRAAGMLRSLMRDRQQVVDMYSMGNARTGMDQQTMFNPVNKAPPQYPNQGLAHANLDQQQQQQLMMNSNSSMQTASRLSHFSQPNTNMNISAGMNAGQMRMQGQMSRYPAPPSLSRTMNMGNENIDSSQFTNYGMQQQQHRTQAMMSVNPNNFNSNYNEQFFMIQKRRMAQRQMMLQQQQNMLQNQNFSTTINMNNPANLLQDTSKQIGSTIPMNDSFNSTDNDKTNNSVFRQQMLSQQQQSQRQQINHQPQQLQHLQHQQQQLNQQRINSQHRNNQQQQTLNNSLNMTANEQTNNTMKLDSNKNLLSHNMNNNPPTQHILSPKQTMNLTNITNDSVGDDDDGDTDLDSLLNNPPDSFDLFKIFS